MIGQEHLFLDKAQESLAGAQSEFANGRYNNCANRCYYACFQAAIYAVEQASIQPTSTPARWGHDFVQAQLAGQLVNRRKLYPREVHEALVRNYGLRQAADYIIYRIWSLRPRPGVPCGVRKNFWAQSSEEVKVYEPTN